MNNEKLEAGLASDLNRELGFNVGDKCLVVFKPQYLTNSEDGIVIECCIEIIEQTTKTTSKTKETNKKYIVSFGLDSTTVSDEVMFSLDKKEDANNLARVFLMQSIESAKNKIEKLGLALDLVKT